MKNVLLGILLGLILIGAISVGGQYTVDSRQFYHLVSSLSTVNNPLGPQKMHVIPFQSRQSLAKDENAGTASTKPVAPSQETEKQATGSEPAPSGSQPYSIVINIPAFRLKLYENGKQIKVYPVCAGMPQYRSPVRSGMKINRILWNPSWGPPPGADWAKNDHSKGPGKWNPVGLVKMPIKGYVFVHGTYKIKSLGFAWSHGCFRMANEDAVELAWFLQSHVGSNRPDQSPDYYRSNHRTTMVYLNQSVPVDLIYETIEVYDGKLFVHPDVYRRGTNTEERVIAKLDEAGWLPNHDKSAVDLVKIRRMIDRSPKETAIAKQKEVIVK